MLPLILAALAEEENALLELCPGDALQERTIEPRLGIRCRRAKLATGGEFLLARTGVGPVNAALACGWITAACPEVDALVLLGVGGALAPELRIGELVVATEVLQHDSFSSLDRGHPRMRPGSYILTGDDAIGHIAPFPADAALAAGLRAAAPDARAGAVLSGSEFVGTVERKRAVASLHAEALLVDMEAAGVAQVAHRLGLPFAVAKTVADRLQPDGTIEQDFRACLRGASANAARLLHGWLVKNK